MGDVCKIQIVEDELMIRQGIRHFVDWEAHGFEIVAEAKNGREALEMLDRFEPNIVITDIVMPIMNGIELIKEIRRGYPQTQVVVLSGYNDLEYVKSSFRLGACDYILKPMLNPSELLSAIKTAAERAGFKPCADAGGSSVSHGIGRILSGYCPEKAIEAVKVHFSENWFTLLGMTGTYPDGISSGMESLLRLMSGIEGEYLKGIDYVRVVFNEETLLYVINHSERDSGIREALSSMVRLAAIENPEIFFVCGNSFYGAENIGAAYRNEFSGYLRERFYNKGRNFMTLQDFEITADKCVFKFSELSKLLSVGNVEQAVSFLAERFINIINNKYMQETGVKTLAQNAVYQVIAVMEEKGADPKRLDDIKKDCMAKISKACFADDFLDGLLKTLNDLSDFFKEFNDKSDESVMLKILAYINAHYNEPLTLSEIAEKFSFNYNYLSAYFGTNNSEGFSKYLNRVRISRAEEMLLNSDMHVSDICLSVGYTDHSYFTRVFKKYTNLTPSRYRSKLKRGDHEQI